MAQPEHSIHEVLQRNLLPAMINGEFHCGDPETGAPTTYPVQCSSLRKDGYVMIKDRPCKIVEMTTSESGKHGHVKVHLVGLDIFTQKKCEDIFPSTDNLDVPIVFRGEYQVEAVSDGYLILQNDCGRHIHDLKVPEGKMGEEIKESLDLGKIYLINVLQAVGESKVLPR